MGRSLGVKEGGLMDFMAVRKKEELWWREQHCILEFGIYCS